MTDKSESTSVSDDAKVLPKRQGRGWIKDPHYTFFGAIFSIPACAYSFVRDQLPDKIVKFLADKEPRILETRVTAHPLYKPLKLNISFRANCSGKMPLSLLAATIWIACS